MPHHHFTYDTVLKHFHCALFPSTSNQEVASREMCLSEFFSEGMCLSDEKIDMFFFTALCWAGLAQYLSQAFTGQIVNLVAHIEPNLQFCYVLVLWLAWRSTISQTQLAAR
jgi:hypothetical protein